LPFVTSLPNEGLIHEAIFFYSLVLDRPGVSRCQGLVLVTLVSPGKRLALVTLVSPGQEVVLASLVNPGDHMSSYRDISPTTCVATIKAVGNIEPGRCRFIHIASLPRIFILLLSSSLFDFSSFGALFFVFFRLMRFHFFPSCLFY
jgi:hypothetical protein